MLTQNLSPRLKQGIALAVFAGVNSGFSIFYNKIVVVGGIDPLIFNLLKNGGVVLLLAPLLLTLPKTASLQTISKKSWQKLILIGIIGGSIPYFLFFEGLRTVPAINATLIQKSMFIWVAILAIPLLKEKLHPLQLIGYIAIAASNLVLGGFSGFKLSIAELMIITAAMLWSFEIVLSKYTLRLVDARVLAFARMFFGLFVLFAIALISNKAILLTRLDPQQVMPIAGSVLLLASYGVAFYTALKLAPATLVTSILIIATPITNLLTAAFVTHTLPQTQVINLLLAFFGIAIIIGFNQLPKTQSKQHAPARA